MNMNKTYIIAAAVVIGVAVLASFLILSPKKAQKSQTSTVQETSTVSPFPSPTTPAMQEEVMIPITVSGFDPQTVTVKVGTKITWVNNSGKMANVSSAPHPTHTLYPPLNLGNIKAGASISLVFDKAGTYTYHNHLDPTQTGTIIVK